MQEVILAQPSVARHDQIREVVGFFAQQKLVNS